MKNLFILFFLCMIAITVNAQKQFYPGIKAGGSLATWSGGHSVGGSSRLSYYGGLTGSFKLTNKFIIQPEVLYSNVGSELDNNSYEFEYIHIPLLFKYQTTGGFYGETGPQIGFLMSAKQKSNGVVSDQKEYLRPMDFLWAVGLGFKFKPGIEIGIRHAMGLSKIGLPEGDLKNQIFSLGVAYTFGK